MSDIEDYAEDVDLDWLYVEDAYDEVDELAEHACPSPNVEFDDDRIDVDYDPYHYFEDLSYLSDSYYDVDKTRGRPSIDPQKKQSPSKKRKLASGKDRQPTKHTKHDVYITADPGPVTWRSRNSDFLSSRAPVASQLELRAYPKVALFKDWRGRFNDVRGIGKPQPVDEGDLDVEGDADDEEDGEDLDDAEQTTSSAGAIDLGDLSAVAGLLTEESMGQLRAAMEAKGLDPEAVEVVLADLLAGREPEFDDNDDDDEDGDEANKPASRPADEGKKPQDKPEPAPTNQSASSSRRNKPKAAPTNHPPPKTEAEAQAPPARPNKRKHAASEDAVEMTADKPPSRSKRAKAQPAAAAESAPPQPPSTPGSLTKTTRSGRKRK